MALSTSLWKTRRLAPRAERVLERRAAESPAVAAYQDSLKPHAEQLRLAYDKAARFRAEWQRELAEGRGSLARLLEAMQSWLPLFQRDVEGFDGASFGDRPTVADDVIEDAGRLIDVALDYAETRGTPLQYHEPCIGALEPLLKTAATETAEAEAADREYQQLMADVREAAEAFQSDLVAFRRTLAAVFGRSDKDYQKLRATRAHLVDADDDEDAPGAPEKVEAAPDGTQEPE